MGGLDAVVKEFLKNTKVVADIGNFKLFGGEQRILPEQLQEMDTVVLTVPYGTDQAAPPAQKFRDRLMAVVDDHGPMRLVRLVLGDEAEAKTQYAEPVKSLYYDAAQYADQVNHAGVSWKRERKENRKLREAEKIREIIVRQLTSEGGAGLPASDAADRKEHPTSGEFLGNFRKPGLHDLRAGLYRLRDLIQGHTHP